jgi:hypothetical protein
LAGNGRLAATAAATSSAWTPATALGSSRGTRPRLWAAPRAGRLGCSPARAKQAGNGHGPVVFPRAGPISLTEKSFSISFIILDEKHLENDFLVILAPKFVK